MKYTKHLLTIAFLTTSLSCANAASSDQTNATTPNASDSGASSGYSNNETSTQQKAAPDDVVKELYKLHDTDKSPLYTAKDRAAMEKYFSKDFVDLVWVGGEKPNLMNKLALDGDALYGSQMSAVKIKKLDVGKAQINGKNASVPVNYEATGEGQESEKGSLTYELVRENAGWRIANIKCEGFSTGSLIGLIKSLLETSEESNKELDKGSENVKPPFVGTRWFVTRPTSSGTGTPRYYLTINAENYMFCGFVQTNQADGMETKEEVALGKFKDKFNCVFKNESGGSHNYRIEGNYIYETNNNDQVIKSKACCKSGDDSQECRCKGEFIE